MLFFWLYNVIKYSNILSHIKIEKIIEKSSHVKYQKRSGAVEACWAHNPKVVGSKPTFAKIFFELYTINYHIMKNPQEPGPVKERGPY